MKVTKAQEGFIKDLFMNYLKNCFLVNWYDLSLSINNFSIHITFFSERNLNSEVNICLSFSLAGLQRVDVTQNADIHRQEPDNTWPMDLTRSHDGKIIPFF